jgi:transcriptional regulator of arginine metabolism
MPSSIEQREDRHRVIRRLLRRHRVGNQGELVELLAGLDFMVTQSSVSRDLHELGAFKVDGIYRLPERGEGGAATTPDPAVIGRFVTGMRSAGPHLLVVRTAVGTAPAVGLAIDAASWVEVAGTIAGDDTLFLATPGRREQRRVEQRLIELSGKGQAHG